MAASDITVAALTATPGAGQITLQWTYSDPRNGALPNIALDAVEVHAAGTNDRAGATRVVEGLTFATHSGLIRAAVNYYWIRARDKLGGYGPWYPAGATSGVSGTELIGGLTVPAVASLAASGGVGLNSLSWTLTDPNSNGLGDLALDVVEVHAASTNDRTGATKVAEGKTFSIHNGLARGVTRYYWVRPRHVNGTNGSFYPASSTGGVSATELSGNVLLASPGYWELPSGLIFEWGTTATNAVTGMGSAPTQRIGSATGIVYHWSGVSSAALTTTEGEIVQLDGITSSGGAWHAQFRVIKSINGGVVAVSGSQNVDWFCIGRN